MKSGLILRPVRFRLLIVFEEFKCGKMISTLEWIRPAHIQVVISGEPYKHPALVYSEEPIDLVIDSVPTSTRTLLGLGEQEEIDAMCQLLGQSNSTEA